MSNLLVMATTPNSLISTLKTLESGGQGLAFGIGYGTGVRLGYTDVYPLVKGRAERILKMLGLNFVDTGLMSGSGAISPEPLKLPFGLK